MTDSVDDFPKCIRLIRQQLGLTQEGLAQLLGVSFTSVNRWENGQTKPSKLARRQIDALCNGNEKRMLGFNLQSTFSEKEEKE